MVKKISVPPDGGWGWMIVGSYALHHLIAVPIMQGFGLIFKDTFRDLGFSATDISFIMNTNAALSMFCGIINGPLLKHLGYRKVSLCGAFFLTIGVFLTAYAHTFSQFMVTYGLITSLGIGMGLSSYPLALNTYFLKKRSQAAGYTMTICGFGPVIMPQIISLLLFLYGVKGAVIIVAGIACHTCISAVLLQPIERHMKEEIVEDDDEAKDKLITQGEKSISKPHTPYNRSRAASIRSLQEQMDIESKFGIDTPLAGSLLSLSPVLPTKSMSISSRKNTYGDLKYAEEESDEEVEQDRVRHEETHKAKTIMNIENGKNKDNSDGTHNNMYIVKVYNNDLSVKKQKNDSLLSRTGQALVKLFDLTLLKDPIFVNIVIGMSLAVFAELTFSLLTPFIMQDYGLSTQQIATFMSTLSVADICFRFLAPYASELFKKPARIMYTWALLLLIASRTSLLFTHNYYALLACSAFLGVAKGFRTVYWTLVIPNHVSIERLPNALGLQSALNGIFIWIGGPFLGFVRDLTGSYKNCIIVINCVTFTTVTMWTIEYVYTGLKAKKKSVEGESVK